MRVTALDGRAITVDRRWLPWRPRERRIDDGVISSPFDLAHDADDPAGLLVALVVGTFLFLFGGILLAALVFAGEALLLLLLIVPLLGLARALWLLPWSIQARSEGTLLGLASARGWRASAERIREISEAYQRGEDPFGAPGANP